MTRYELSWYEITGTNMIGCCIVCYTIEYIEEYSEQLEETHLFNINT